MSQTTQPPQSSADTSLIPQNSIPPEDTRKQIERLYKSWPLTPLVSTCIELLRFQNAGWGCSDEWSQGDIWLTLKNVFNGSAVYGLSKFDFIDAELIDYHFKNFNMPAWDRLMKRLDKGPGHSTLMFAITCVKGKIPSEVKSKDADGPLKMSDMVNKLGKILPFPLYVPGKNLW